MMGLDTLLVIGLLIHAVLLQRRMKSSDEEEVGDVSSADDVFEDEYTMPLLDDLDGQQADANHLDELERNDWTNANSEVGSSEVDTSNPDLYQEYPEGSGRFWSRNSVDDQWELVD